MNQIPSFYFLIGKMSIKKQSLSQELICTECWLMTDLFLTKLYEESTVRQRSPAPGPQTSSGPWPVRTEPHRR